MLDYHKTADERMSETYRRRTVAREEELRAIFALMNKPPQRDRIGRWRREMTATDRKRFEAIAGEMLRKLDYDVD